MIACFGLYDGYHESCFPADRLVENRLRLDAFKLNRIGAFAEGASPAEPGVMQALLLHFRQHGKKAIEKVAREQPASYLKILGLLVPREHKVEHSNPVKGLTDEQLEAMIEYLETSLAAQAGAPAKMIEGTIEPISVEVRRG